MNPLDLAISWLRYVMVILPILFLSSLSDTLRYPGWVGVALTVAMLAAAAFPTWVTWRVRRDLIRYKTGLIDPSTAFAVPIFRVLERNPGAVVDVTATRHGDVWRAAYKKDAPDD